MTNTSKQQTSDTSNNSLSSIASILQGGRSAGQELRMQELIHVLIKRKTWIMLCIIFGLVFGLSLSVLSYSKSKAIRQYTVRTSIALNSASQSGLFSRQSLDPDSTDYYLAEDMVDAASYILRSDSMLDRIIEEVNLLGITARDISNSLSLEQYKETQIILITLHWQNASEGVRILQTMNRLAPSLLINTLKLGGVTVINNPTARFVIGANLNLMRNLILGFAIGIVMGSALAILDLILHPTLLTTGDVQRKLHIPLLGTLKDSGDDSLILQEILSKSDEVFQRSSFADSYFALAYTLKRRLHDQAHPCMLVTSTNRGEGKTTVTSSLAAALSQIGIRTLAVDFDFHNPTLGGLFFKEIDPKFTVNAIYQGKTPAKDAVIPVNGNLYILPAQLDRSLMQLNSSTMEIISALKYEYDMILLDTPPVGQIADTMALGELTQHCLFVMQYDSATQAVMKDALDRLSGVDIQVLGGIITRIHHHFNRFHAHQVEARKRIANRRNLKKQKKEKSRSKR